MPEYTPGPAMAARERSRALDWCAVGLPRMSRRAAIAALAAAAVLLSGCEALRGLLPPEDEAPQVSSTWQAHARALSNFRHWFMLGTLAVRTGGEASRVTIRWRQANDSYLARFVGPLGVGLFELEGSEAVVEARFPNGRRISAASPESLLEQEIGWSVPLQGLRYWIVGAPVPDGTTSNMEFDDRGRLARLQQEGWTVIYQQYGGLDGLSLPTRIRFTSETVDATIVIRRWKAESDPA